MQLVQATDQSVPSSPQLAQVRYQVMDWSSGLQLLAQAILQSMGQSVTQQLA